MEIAADVVVSGRLRQQDGSYGTGSVWMASERIVALTNGIPTPAELAGARQVDVGDAFVLPSSPCSRCRTSCA